MIPKLSHPCWGGLLDRTFEFQTRHAALNFLLQKLRTSQDAYMQKCTSLRDFFVKYERILPAEIQQLNR